MEILTYNIIIIIDWFSGLSFPVLPSWLPGIARAAVGALIAYAIWSWAHSPFLHPGSVVHKDVIEIDRDEKQQSIRLPIHNIGTKAAKNCEAVIQLRVGIGDKVVRSFNPIPWLPTRAELVVDDSEHTTRTTIPAGRSATLELIRQHRKNQTQIYTQTGGDKFVLTESGDKYHEPVDESVDYAIQAPGGSSTSDVVRSTGQLSEDQVSDGDWGNAIVEVTVETESAQPLVVNFDAEVNESGRISLERLKQPPTRRFISLLYRGMRRIRRLMADVAEAVGVVTTRLGS